MATGTTPDHLLHLVLSLITLGAWIIMWILVAVAKAGGYRCSECGCTVDWLIMRLFRITVVVTLIGLLLALLG